ncbi:MAG: ATP-binding protein [Planctomycetota bacterium]|jgi:PAS domain S-box-containing protein
MNRQRDGGAGGEAEEGALRRAAEERLRDQGEIDAPGEPADAVRLLHELRVHQIELEMQNEELCRARAKAEEALARYVDLYHAAPVGYLTVAVDGAIQTVNALGARLLVREPSTLIGKRLGALVSHGDRVTLQRFLEQVFNGGTGLTCEVDLLRDERSPRAVIISATVDAAGQECRLILEDVTRFRREEAVLRGARDNLQTVVMEQTADLAEANKRLQQDIAERMRIEEALRESEERYRRLLSSVSSYVYRVEMEGGVPSRTEHGKGCEAVTGYTPEDYARDPSLWISMIQDEDRPEVLRAMDHIMASSEPISIQHRVMRKDGKTRWFHNTLVPHCDRSGRLIHYDGVITDITERIQHEEERIRLEREAQRGEALRYLGQLAAGVAHEVRNPLNSIAITIEILAEQLLENQACAENIDRVRRQVNRLDHLMKDLLELRRPEGNRNSQPTTTASLCRLAVDVWNESNRIVRHTLSTEFSSEAERNRVLVDPERLVQVLVNLLNNAMQHSADDSEIRVSAEVSEDGFAIIRLRDQGLGFSATGLQQAFDPFFSTRTGGSGLGLSISKHIVESYSGTIQIQNNTPPPGCTVEIRLPVFA